jgi:hypothetical protein
MDSNGYRLCYHFNQRDSIQQGECEVTAMSVAMAIYDGYKQVVKHGLVNQQT